MNVPYNAINSQDAAQILGCHRATFLKWCKDGRINVTNLGEGTTRARYMVSEEEIDYLKRLKRKWGGKKFIQHYNKNWNVKKKTPVISVIPDEKDIYAAFNQEMPTEDKKEQFAPVDEKELFASQNEGYTLQAEEPKVKEVSAPTYELEQFASQSKTVAYQDIEELPTREKFDLDKITTTISYMQDIKERLNDLEAERNQLRAEYEQLKQEVMEAI